MFWPYLLRFNLDFIDSRTHAILATCSTSFSAYLVLFTLFLYCFLFCACFCLCDRVDDVSYMEDQEQVIEEEQQQFGEEGKWPPPSAYFVLSC